MFPPDGISEKASIRDWILDARLWACVWDRQAMTVAAGAPSRSGTEPHELVWEALGLALAQRHSTAGRYFKTCFLYCTVCWAAEATGEAGIDDSGPTLLGGGHHLKEADFATGEVRNDGKRATPSQLAATSSVRERKRGIRSAIPGRQPPWPVILAPCGAKLSGVHASLGPRGAKGGQEACACSTAFRVLLSAGTPALFLPPQILRTFSTTMPSNQPTTTPDPRL